MSTIYDLGLLLRGRGPFDHRTGNRFRFLLFAVREILAGNATAPRQELADAVPRPSATVGRHLRQETRQASSRENAAVQGRQRRDLPQSAREAPRGAARLRARCSHRHRSLQTSARCLLATLLVRSRRAVSLFQCRSPAPRRPAVESRTLPESARSPTTVQWTAWLSRRLERSRRS